MDRSRSRSVILVTGLASYLLAGLACSLSEAVDKQVQRAVCAELDNLSPEKMDELFTTARQQLEASGIAFDHEVWGDPQRFQALLDELDRVTNCADSTAAGAQSASFALEGTRTDFCGPGKQNNGELASAANLHVDDVLSASPPTRPRELRRVGRPTDMVGPVQVFAILPPFACMFSSLISAFRGVKATSDGREFDGDQTDMRGLDTA